MADVVTFTITLPVNAFPFEEAVKAMEDAMHAQHIAGNPAAAQALSTVTMLARAGLLAFQTSINQPVIFPAPTTTKREVI